MITLGLPHKTGVWQLSEGRLDPDGCWFVILESLKLPPIGAGPDDDFCELSFGCIKGDNRGTLAHWLAPTSRSLRPITKLLDAVGRRVDLGLPYVPIVWLDSDYYETLNLQHHLYMPVFHIVGWLKDDDRGGGGKPVTPPPSGGGKKTYAFAGDVNKGKAPVQ